jgi:hypothetical protein
MREVVPHERFVDAWLSRRAQPMTAERMADLLVCALDVVSARSRLVLGDVTLEAISGRILADARKSYPFLQRIGLRLVRPANEDPRPALSSAASVDELHAATRSIVVGLLGVLSRTTGEILTPGLYHDLDAIITDERSDSRRPKAKKKAATL